MRSLRPIASAARASTRPTPTPTPSPSPCLLCAHRTPPSASLRYQSTSTPSSTEQETSAPPQTHYTFFPSTLPSGPPPAGRFTIDTSALKREFLQLQARAHPDLHPPSQKARAQALSARINEAYKTLQSPLLRAQYLLSLQGVEVGEEAKLDDAELLMEVLEARERIEEAESEEELVGLKEENEGRIAESVRVLEEAFERDDVGKARGEAVRLRYWVNIKESLDGWEKGKGVVLEH
ncbi:Co-chaperone Hsc20 [Bimuria novae-zelandiae CBS 107.79]|uniref:Co-chaperone Hsc20 n=1 Tax=Bimuria novae-zelandiae CBS 107.79 TaxID=1447943 RepID=A0A6A5UXQ0_9PLEO|nr:Co-chaperone Hsc20 [Bimuria novae-zelandiae CBS 107.79]